MAQYHTQGPSSAYPATLGILSKKDLAIEPEVFMIQLSQSAPFFAQTLHFQIKMREFLQDTSQILTWGSFIWLHDSFQRKDFSFQPMA